MDESGAAMERPTHLPSAAGPASPADATPDQVATALLALYRLALTLSAAAVLRRLSLAARSGDWHLVSSPEQVAGVWLGLLVPHVALWAQLSPLSLPSLGMCAVNDPAVVAGLAHDRPWEAHATTLRALREALAGARDERRLQVRVTLARPVGAGDEVPPSRAITVAAVWLGHVLDALEALGDPPRPVWAYLREDDDEHRLLVLDGGAWLAELDEDGPPPLLTGRAAAPWPLALEEVVSTIDARSVGGCRVSFVSLEVH